MTNVVTLQAVKDGKVEQPVESRLDPLRMVFISARVDLRPLMLALGQVQVMKHTTMEMSVKDIAKRKAAIEARAVKGK